MKQSIICMALVVFLGVQTATAQKKEFKEVIKKELSYENSGGDRMLEIQNLNGSITVEGYDGDMVLLEVDKTISARSANDLELGKRR